MRQSHDQGVARPLVAVVTALAFIFSPFSVLAQQEPSAEGAAEREEADGSETETAEEQPAESNEQAGPTPQVFLVPTQAVHDGISSIIPERIGDLLRDQLEGKPAIDLLARYDRLEPQGGGQANAADAAAKRSYTSGIGLLTAGEDEKASEAFQEAVDIMEKNIGELRNFDVLADAYKNMALAYFNAGFDFDGRKHMKVFAHLRPDAELDEEKFPIELREVFDDETKKIEKAGPGKLVVEADIDEAVIFVDGVEKGTSPATLKDVGYGYHYLVVRAPSGAVWSEQIRVRGRGKTQKFDVELGAAVSQSSGEDEGDSEPAFYVGLKQGIKSGSFGEDLQPYLAELTNRTGAGYVGWVAMLKEPSGYVAVPFVHRSDDGLMVRGEGVEFDLDLSNLRVGVNKLANRIVEVVETMPEEKAITAVELGDSVEPQESTAVEGDGDPQEGAPQVEGEPAAADDSKSAVATNEQRDDEANSVRPLPEPSDKEGESDKWLWLGAGGAAVLVTGLVVGGLVVMSDGESDEPGSFAAQLTW